MTLPNIESAFVFTILRLPDAAKTSYRTKCVKDAVGA